MTPDPLSRGRMFNAFLQARGLDLLILVFIHFLLPLTDNAIDAVPFSAGIAVMLVSYILILFDTVDALLGAIGKTSIRPIGTGTYYMYKISQVVGKKIADNAIFAKTTFIRAVHPVISKTICCSESIIQRFLR